jgi:hypothetical protein
MAVGRAQRRAERQARFGEVFGAKAKIALDLAEVLEFAWHDCYRELTPPDDVIEEILICSEGSVEKMIGAVHLAVIDSRDLRMWANGIRSGRR